MGKYTKSDIKRIAIAMRRQKIDHPERPYSLLTGAGCSKSAGIPLAPELVREIKEKYPEEIARFLEEDCSDDYGACMSVLSGNEVKAVLQPHLDGAGVNWGHLGIAALMDAGYVGRVLTFNFDSILARACGMLGKYPATYDFVSGASKRTDYIAQKAILHLHGQGHSIAMLNSDGETAAHAENLRPLLTHVLSQTPLLVAGYSGKSDSVFDVLEDLYDGTERLCWTGYEEECPSHVARLLSKRSMVAEYIGGADSDQFFVDLATKLGCWPPKLFSNPYAHLLNELKPVVDYPGADTDMLSETRTELKVHADQAETEEDTARDLFMKGDFKAVVSLLGDNPKTDEDRHILGYALMRMANSLGEQIAVGFPEEHREEMLRLYKNASQYLKGDHTLFYNWGLALATLAELYDDQDLFLISFEKYAKAAEIKPNDHDTFNNWGNALSTLAAQTQDAELFKESFEKYAKATDIKPDNHKAFYNWGHALSELAAQTQDPGLFKESFEKYAKATDIKPDNHEAYENWSNALATLFDLSHEAHLLVEAESVLNIAKGFAPNKIYNLACLYAKQGKSDEAIAALIHCKDKGTLPSGGRAHLETDIDLNSLRDHPEFIALLARLSAPEPRNP